MGGEDVFHDEGYAMEKGAALAGGAFAVQVVSGGEEGLGRGQGGECIEVETGMVVRLNLREIGLHELHRCDSAILEKCLGFCSCECEDVTW